MNPLIRKEIRLLLPAWVAAMLLAILPALVLDLGWLADLYSGVYARDYVDLLAFDLPMIFSIGVLFLGVSSFGQELNSGAFTLLLSQPIDRRRVWQVKTIALLLAFISVCVAGMTAIWSQFYIFQGALVNPADLTAHESGTLEFLALSCLVMFSGGLWTTLLLRQTAGAFWFTLLIPLAIILAIQTGMSLFPVTDQIVDNITMAVLFIYGIAGLFYARRLIFNVEDLPGTGREITFLWRKERTTSTAAARSRQPRHWVSASVWKEIQLHQVNFFIAIVVLALNLLSLLARKIHPHFDNPDIGFMLEQVWVLWLLMPLLIGCAAIAEERKLGIIESQLCLPVSRRAQFVIKFLVALVLSLLFGAVIPSIIEHTVNFGETDWFSFWVFYAAAALFLVSFYASSLARSTLQAIGFAVALPIVVGSVIALYLVLTFYERPEYEQVGKFICLVYVGVPVAVLVLLGLILRNFKWLHENLKLWRYNVIVIAISLGVIFSLSDAIYFRVWECFAPLESPHGPARMAADAPVKLYGNWRNIVATLPDGRLWNEDIHDREIGTQKIGSMSWEIWSPALPSQRFIGGSNWLAVAPSSYVDLGIQSDGSLWAVHYNGISMNPQIHQIGRDTDWTAAARTAGAFLLLKKDGSLWIWGTNDAKMYGEKIKKDLATMPTRLGNQSDWTSLFPYSTYWALAKKTDGTQWSWYPETYRTNLPHLALQTNVNDQWLSYSFDFEWSAGVSTNNELWFFYHPMHWSWDDGIPTYSLAIRVSADPVWKAVTFSDSGDPLLLKTDGTLWKWKFPRQQDWANFRQQPFNPVQLGRNSDWVALIPGDRIGTVLAIDGSLWSWGQMSDRTWLAPSRKPVYMGNIFQGAGQR
jgi:ABC-type transport system involved in multi-copper enzyme maturation permease subunit